jgi:hypothetical protein
MRTIAAGTLAFVSLCTACAGASRHEPAASKPDAEGPKRDGGSTAPERERLVSEFLADAGGGWTSLIEAHWVLPANEEAYRCARVTVTKDVAVHALHALSPLGTHHNSLYLSSSPSEADGITECDASELGPRAIGGAGIGTNDFVMPEGVAIKLHKGQQILVNLHLFNVSDEPIEGTSGFLARILPVDQVEHEADEVLAGPLQLEIPAGSKNVVQGGQCRISYDSTVFAVGPHAHMHATHIKAVAESSIDGTVVLHDAPFSFESQVGHLVGPVRMKAGDLVKVSCTYDNMTDHPIEFGNSSLDEMCFATLWRYPPAETPSPLCVN